MAKKVILPTVLKLEYVDNETVKLNYVFNRWLNMLRDYGKLDDFTQNEDFELILKVIRKPEIKGVVRQSILTCRNYALNVVENKGNLIKALIHALKLISAELEDVAVGRVTKDYADHGMTERYRSLTKKIKKENIRNIGKNIMYTDVNTDDSRTTKLVRRFVEKRAAQAVHRQLGKRGRETNVFRQSVRRATSFSLYNATITEYSKEKRVAGTHWKEVYMPYSRRFVLKNKHSYNTYEEALESCKLYTMRYPEDLYPMTPYMCNRCHKWHIGHDRRLNPLEVGENADDINLRRD